MKTICVTHTNWGFELCRKNKSDNFKLLYDISHANQ